MAAARNVTAVEIPGLKDGYRAFYNPGGPGPEPFAGVPYTAPGPRDLEPVIIALDDPMRVSRDPRSAAWFSWQLVAAAVLLLAGILLMVVRRRSKHAPQPVSNSEAINSKSTQSTTQTRPD